VLVRGLNVAVERAPGSDIEPSIHVEGAILSILRRMIGVKLQRGAPVEIQPVPRKVRQQVEAWLERRDQIVCRPRGREYVAIVSLIELCTREPEEVSEA
jgi:hypothetical protein